MFGSDSIPQKCKLGGWFELAFSHEGTTYAAACGKALSIQETVWQICSLTSFPEWELIDSGQGNTSRSQAR